MSRILTYVHEQSEQTRKDQAQQLLENDELMNATCTELQRMQVEHLQQVKQLTKRIEALHMKLERVQVN